MHKPTSNQNGYIDPSLSYVKSLLYLCMNSYIIIIIKGPLTSKKPYPILSYTNTSSCLLVFLSPTGLDVGGVKGKCVHACIESHAQASYAQIFVPISYHLHILRRLGELWWLIVGMICRINMKIALRITNKLWRACIMISSFCASTPKMCVRWGGSICVPKI